MTNKPKKTPEELHAIRQAVGRKGGESTRDRHGREHFQQAGKLGYKKLTRPPKLCLCCGKPTRGVLIRETRRVVLVCAECIEALISGSKSDGTI